MSVLFPESPLLLASLLFPGMISVTGVRPVSGIPVAAGIRALPSMTAVTGFRPVSGIPVAAGVRALTGVPAVVGLHAILLAPVSCLNTYYCLFCFWGSSYFRRPCSCQPVPDVAGVPTECFTWWKRKPKNLLYCGRKSPGCDSLAHVLLGGRGSSCIGMAA